MGAPDQYPEAMPEANTLLVSETIRCRRPSPEDDNAQAIESWFTRSLTGDETSRGYVFAWVHAGASDYFSAKAGIEPLLSLQDAEDLASECVVEFSKSWKRVRSVTHYCRRMYKNNLRRYLKRRRGALHRECALEPEAIEQLGCEAVLVRPEFEFERFTDDDLKRIRFATNELESADEVVRDLFHYRVFAGALTYGEIAEFAGATETSLRMRMARFNRRVRRRYNREIGHVEATGGQSREDLQS